MKIILLIVGLIILSGLPVGAISAETKLLAVTGPEEGELGTVADLVLEVENGNGRVFIDTYPLTKFDTQISTRFAKEIACDLLEADCSKYDFIYTINSGSSIIGGPSASAAIAVVTVSVLNNLNLDPTVAITGTINSGGLVGPVGKIKEKIDAASENGIKKVLVSRGATQILENNTSLNFTEYGLSLGIDVIEVISLEQALYHFTGKKFDNSHKELSVDNQYTKTMQQLSGILCNRSNELRTKVLETSNFVESNIFYEALNLTLESDEAISNKRFYAAASYCFGANVKFSNLILTLDTNNLSELIDNIEFAMGKLNAKIEQAPKKTITDLQAYIIVKERLLETRDILNNLKSESNISISELSYAKERLYSALSWSEFLNKPGKSFVLDNKVLESSCKTKINEANERLIFARLILPNSLFDSERDIQKALVHANEGNFALCLFKASKAKAEANIIYSVSGVSNSELESLVENRLEVLKKEIIKTTEAEIFPILGYSYYEYATDLKEKDLFSSLLYLEYALELTDMDIYFRNYDNTIIHSFRLNFHKSEFIFGFSFGLLTAAIIFYFGRIINTQRKSRRTSTGKKR